MTAAAATPRTHRVAPWWVGYLLISPLRRWTQDPHRFLEPYVKPGDLVLELGPGMGFFTPALAELVGAQGRVVAVDCQERMLAGLRSRVRRAGFLDRLDARHCPPETLAVADLAGRVDFVLAVNVIHEAPDVARMLGEAAHTLKPGGTLLLAEPAGHVDEATFGHELELAHEAGLVEARPAPAARRLTALLRKPASGER